MYAQLALGLFLIFSGIGVLLAWALPRYKIYRYRLSGQAALAKADCESKVTVRRALAEQEAAEHLAQAEVIRARGVASAIEIIGRRLKDDHAYLRYLWIEKLNEQDVQLIYVPTEAGLPILEAGRAIGLKPSNDETA